HLTIETESLEDRLRARGILETTFVLKLLLKIAVALEDLLQIVARVSHAMLELVHLVFDLLQPAKRRQRRLMHGRSRLEVHMLVQQAQLYATRTDHLAAIGRLLTSDQSKDRALPGAVAADKPDV